MSANLPSAQLTVAWTDIPVDCCTRITFTASSLPSCPTALCTWKDRSFQTLLTLQEGEILIRPAKTSNMAAGCKPVLGKQKQLAPRQILRRGLRVEHRAPD